MSTTTTYHLIKEYTIIRQLVINIKQNDNEMWNKSEGMRNNKKKWNKSTKWEN
jgi:hypothetical protein